MGALIEQLSVQVLSTFVFVLARVGGMMMTAPLFSSVEIPLQVKIFLTVAISFLLAPLQWGRIVETPDTLLGLGIIIGGESLIGVALGIGLMIVMAGIQIAGQIAGLLGGMSLADVFNPAFDSEVPLFSHVISLVMLAVFSIIGGHRRLLAALLHTFAELPIGSPYGFESTGEFMITLLGESMTLGMRAAAPIMTALVLTNILLGLVGRSMPSMNILSLGFGLNSMITLGMMALCLSTVAHIFEANMDDALIRMNESLIAPSATTRSPQVE